MDGVTAVALASTAFEANGSTLLRMALRGTVAIRRFVADLDVPWLVSTNQVISVFTDFDSEHAVDYAGTYALALRLFEFLEMAAEVDTIISLDGSPHRFVAGGSVAFLSDHFRLGLFASGALTGATAASQGEWSAGRSLGLGICATVAACE
ncbi:MAG: hypothetical protein ACI9OJ_001838 [Myxococcota bacterium]|jgi:hypothetical protein